MHVTPIFKTFALLVALGMLAGLFPATGHANQDEGAQLVYEGWDLAKNKGPILWYVRDPEKREAMEEDLVLLRMFNEAQKAKKRRRAIGAAFFYPGITITALGLVGGLFQQMIGLYDETTGNQIMIGGVLGGLALVGPGIYFRAKESKQEKEYLEYIKKKYDILPILRKQPDGSTLFALMVHGRF